MRLAASPGTRRASDARLDMALDGPFHVAREHVALEVHAIAGRTVVERGDREGMRDHGHRERARGAPEDRQADAVDGDRSLLHEQARERGREAETVERAVADGGE